VNLLNDRSNFREDMPIFFLHFFNMAAFRHLGFVMRVFWTAHEAHLVVFITVQNLVGIDAVVFFDFASLA